MGDVAAAVETLRVVIFREADHWLAQGLERDIAVEGGDLNDLIRRLTLAIMAEAATLDALGQAPKYFQDLWPLCAGAFEPATPITLDAGLKLEIILGMAA